MKLLSARFGGGCGGSGKFDLRHSLEELVKIIEWVTLQEQS